MNFPLLHCWIGPLYTDACLVVYICSFLFCISQDNITDVSFCWFCLKGTLTFFITRTTVCKEQRKVRRDLNKCMLPYTEDPHKVTLRSHAVSVRTAIIQRDISLFSREPWECFCNSPNPFFIRLFLYLFMTRRLSLGN